MPLLNIDKLLNFAISLEDIGERFFLSWADKAETESVQRFFKILAKDEANHKQIFQNLKKKANIIQNKNALNQGEYEANFKTFSESIIFNHHEIQQVKDLPAAIEMAKKQELDAQLFFTDLKQYLAAEYHGIMDKIILEEQKHFADLEKLEEKLSKSPE